MISKKFFTSSLVYTLVGALPLASSIILLPFYTWYLKTDKFGELAIYIAFTFLVQILVVFSMDAALSVFYYDYHEKKKELKEYIGTMVSAMIISGSITILISLIIGNWAFKALFTGNEITFYPYGFMSVVTAFFNVFFKAYCTILINQQKPLKFFWVNFFNFVITIIISLAGLYFYKHTLVGPMWGRFLSGVGIFILAFILFTSEFGLYFKFDYIKKTFIYSAPLLLYFIFVWSLTYLDRYIINYFMNPSDVGIYDFTVRGTSVIDFVMIGLANAMMPKLFSIWKSDKLENNSPEVNRYFHSFSAISIILIAGIILFLPILIPLVIYNHSYYPAFKYIPLAALNYLFRGIILVYYLPIYFFKKTKVLPWIYFVSALIQIPLTIVLVKYYGLWGALWSAFLTKPIQAILMYVFSRDLIHFTYNKMKMIVLPVLYSIIVICGEIYLKSINPILLHFVEMVISSMVIFMLFRKELIVTFQKIVIDGVLKKLLKN